MQGRNPTQSITQKRKRSRSVQFIGSHFKMYNRGKQTKQRHSYLRFKTGSDQNCSVPIFHVCRTTKIFCLLSDVPEQLQAERPSLSKHRNLIKEQTEAGLSCSLRCLSAGGNDTGSFPSSSSRRLSAPALGPSATGVPIPCQYD